MAEEWIISLANAATSALVAAAGTDAWQAAKRGFARLLGRGNKKRVELASGRLDELAAELQADSGEGAGNGAGSDRLIIAWQARLQDLLEENPEFADDLRRLIGEIEAKLSSKDSIQLQNSIARDSAKQYNVQQRRGTVNIYQAEASSARAETPDRRVYFFIVGCGVGNRVALIPFELTDDSKGSLLEFADALQHTGATSADIAYIFELSEKGIPAEKSSEKLVERYFNFMKEVTPQIRSRATAVEYQWYSLGRLLYEITTDAVMSSLGNASLRVERDALTHLAETMTIPSGLRADLIKFARDEDDSDEHPLERANRLALICYEVL